MSSVKNNLYLNIYGQMGMVTHCCLSHRIIEKNILLKQALPQLSKNWFLVLVVVLNDVMFCLIIKNQKHK